MAARVQGTSVIYIHRVPTPMRNATHSIQNCGPHLKEGEVVVVAVDQAATRTATVPRTNGCATSAARLVTLSGTATRIPQDMEIRASRRRQKSGRGADGLMPKNLGGAGSKVSAWIAEAAAASSAALAHRRNAMVGRMVVSRRRWADLLQRQWPPPTPRWPRTRTHPP